jgi:hypothetical protein
MQRAQQKRKENVETITMDGVKEHLLGRIRDADLFKDPFPYMNITNLFPDDYYSTLLRELPSDQAYAKYHAPYDARFYIDFKPQADLTQRAFWRDLLALLASQEFLEGMAHKFGDEISAVYKTRPNYIEPHRSGKGVKIGSRMILTRDYASYSISPHTDAPPKFITALFYLAKDESMLNFGTSIYAPKDKNFKQWGADRFQDAHLPYENFDVAATMPYRPNSALVFLKTDNSFHGVERSAEYSNKGRDMLMWVPEIGVNERSWGNNSLPLEIFYGA